MWPSLPTLNHGKTTLIDGLLRQAKIFRENQVVAERIMDSNDLERERGITSSPNTPPSPSLITKLVSSSNSTS